MAPSPSTCISCGRTFAENHELAAIPDAGKVAFDPTHHRVWRICTSCGEWNLLGTEAAAAALPELEARFTAAIPGGALELDLAPVRISSRLELLRIGHLAPATPGDSRDMRLRGEVDHRTRMVRWGIGVGVVVFLAWCAFTLWISHGDISVALELLLLYSIVDLGQYLLKQLRGKRPPDHPPVMAIGVLAIAVALAFAAHQQAMLEYVAIGVLATSPLMVLIDIAWSRRSVARVRLGNGLKLRLTRKDIERLTLSWVPGDSNLSLHDLPNGASLVGPDVGITFRRVYAWNLKLGLVHLAATLNQQMESAYTLLSSVGGLAGLLRALEGFRRDNDGRVLIASLPAVYLIALDLVLSEPTRRSQIVDDVVQRALVASRLAGEAEALDEEAR